MESKPKVESSHSLTKVDGIVTVVVSEGAKEIGRAIVDCNKFEAELALDGLMHGVGQRMVDAMALSRDKKTGASPPAAVKLAALLRVTNLLNGGEWTAGSIVYDALAQVTGRTRAEARKAFDALPADEQEAVRASTRIKDAIAALRPPKVDDGSGDAVLDRLMAPRE